MGRQLISTFIAANTRLQGDLQTSGAIHIDGRLQGDIRCDAQLSLGAQGQIQGDIQGQRVLVGGEIRGNIQCERLEILATGKVLGDVRCRQLVIAAGGRLDGRSQPADQVSVKAPALALAGPIAAPAHRPAPSDIKGAA